MRAAAPLLLLALAALALAAPAHAARMLKSSSDPACYPTSATATRYCGLQWTTDASTTLKYKSQSVSHGELTDIMATVPASSASLTKGGCAESNGFMTGTEGTLYYTLEGCGELAFYWNVPFIGSNSYSCTLGCADYTCSYSVVSSDGVDEHVTVELTVKKATA